MKAWGTDMAEQILVLMADWDDETQKILSGWYDDLKLAGFTGKQTPGLPHHISMSTYTLDKEAEAVELMRKAASEFAPLIWRGSTMPVTWALFRSTSGHRIQRYLSMSRMLSTVHCPWS